MSNAGHLAPLKTIYELEVKESLADACVVEIPTKLASKALSILKPIIATSFETSGSYYYLRRLVTTPHLPPSLRDSVQLRDGVPTIHLLITPSLSLTSDAIVAIFRPHVGSENLPVVRTARIPLEPPTTADQAALWSRKYWPCTFNPASQTIQKAPPLQTLRTVQVELNKPARLDSYFALAQSAAIECAREGFGRKVAAVVVDPSTEEAVAVAGDGRWFGPSNVLSTSTGPEDRLAEGRPEHHALMRAIAMVAERARRRRTANENSSSQPAESPGADLGGRALTSIEKIYAATRTEKTASPDHLPEMPPAQSAERPDAYLCHGLDVYLTHEPCIACSMAMVHSRFRACIFARRKPGTGGLCAENDDGGLGYGLFWRKELNWRVLAFQYLSSNGGAVVGEEEKSDGIDKDRKTSFHA